jgi:hypothetical protein
VNPLSGLYTTTVRPPWKCMKQAQDWVTNNST